MARHQKSGTKRLWQNRDLIVLVDMDGVLCDFESHFVKCYREKNPTDPFLPLEERRTFYISDQYANQFGEEYKGKVDDIICSEGFFLDIPPIAGAVEAVKELASMEDVIVMICTTPVTKSYEYCVKEKYQWIARHFGQAWVSKVILTCDKTIVQGDLLIDDKPKIKGLGKNRSWKQVLFASCHNLHLLNNYNLTLMNWTDDSWKKLIQDAKKKL